MPYTTFSDGSVLTASQVNTNFRDQVITTCTSGTRPAGTEGQHIVETDTDREYVYSGSGWVEWGGYGAWTSYTPTLVQSAAVTKTVTYAKYNKMGRQVVINAVLAVTGTGTANNAVTMSLPYTSALSSQLAFGSGYLFDASANINYPGIVVIVTNTTCGFIDSAVTGNVFQGQTGASFGSAVASGDIITMHLVYESTT